MLAPETPLLSPRIARRTQPQMRDQPPSAIFITPHPNIYWLQTAASEDGRGNQLTLPYLSAVVLNRPWVPYLLFVGEQVQPAGGMHRKQANGQKPSIMCINICLYLFSFSDIVSASSVESGEIYIMSIHITKCIQAGHIPMKLSLLQGSIQADFSMSSLCLIAGSWGLKPRRSYN